MKIHLFPLKDSQSFVKLITSVLVVVFLFSSCEFSYQSPVLLNSKCSKQKQYYSSIEDKYGVYFFSSCENQVKGSPWVEQVWFCHKKLTFDESVDLFKQFHHELFFFLKANFEGDPYRNDIDSWNKEEQLYLVIVFESEEGGFYRFPYPIKMYNLEDQIYVTYKNEGSSELLYKTYPFFSK